MTQKLGGKYALDSKIIWSSVVYCLRLTMHVNTITITKFILFNCITHIIKSIRSWINKLVPKSPGPEFTCNQLTPPPPPSSSKPHDWLLGRLKHSCRNFYHSHLEFSGKTPPQIHKCISIDVIYLGGVSCPLYCRRSVGCSWMKNLGSAPLSRADKWSGSGYPINFPDWAIWIPTLDYWIHSADWR